jgi:hypothetical protein
VRLLVRTQATARRHKALKFIVRLLVRTQATTRRLNT